MPRQLSKIQAFPKMPDFPKCLQHIYLEFILILVRKVTNTNNFLKQSLKKNLFWCTLRKKSKYSDKIKQ